MAQAVRKAIATGQHLAVQAGKSPAYLMPAIRHTVAKDTTVVVSTATIALQRQLVDRDLPRLAKALTPLLGRTAADGAVLYISPRSFTGMSCSTACHRYPAALTCDGAGVAAR